MQRDESGALWRAGAPLASLLDRWGSPLHVVDAARLVANAAAFTARPDGVDRACEVYYSYKTNPVPGVLRILHAHGVGAEVASAYELWLALRLGVDPARVVFNGPARSPEGTELALRRGVGLVNLNAHTDISLLAAQAERTGVRQRVGIRVVVPGFEGGPLGERIDTGAALRAFADARACPALDVVAVHSHANGRIDSVESLERLISGLLAFTNTLHQRLGMTPEILDLGGNLACPTVAPIGPGSRRLAIALARPLSAPAPAATISISAYVNRVLERIARHFASAGRTVPRVFVEPGRAISGDAQMLLSRVLSIRDGEVPWAVLDAGINVAEPVRSEFHQVVPLCLGKDPRRRVYRLSGPSCSLADLLYPACELPELSPGDAVGIMDTGAYFVPFSTCFSFPRPAIAVLSGGKAELVRRPETFEDLVRRDDAASSWTDPRPARSSCLRGEDTARAT
jgi:diaminopimelate decarboxylase